jgi:hypothetical protein
MNGGCDAGAPRSTPPCGPCTLGESSRSAARRVRFARVTEGRSDEVKTWGCLIKHARYDWLLLAESHLTRRLFAGMLGKIAALPVPAG